MRNGETQANPRDPVVTGGPADTEAAAAMEEYREWLAAWPGAMSHAAAKRLLLGESG